MTVSVLVATAGRPTLERALDSIASQLNPADQLIVIAETDAILGRAAKYGATLVQSPRGNDWGASERAVGIQHAIGDYVAFLDDDDIWTPGAREAIEQEIVTHDGRPIICRMQIAATGELLWRDGCRIARMGNMGTPMMVLPLARAKAGRWGRRYGNDFEYWASMQWPADQIVWSEAVIASIRP